MGCISFIGCSLYHISSYVQSLGYDAQFGATVISLYNFVCIFSKMIMGRLFDRKGLKGGVIFGAIGIIGSYLLMTISVLHSSVPMLLLIAFFYGIGNTCQSITAPSMVSGVFGVKNYSEIYAKLSTVTLAISAVSTPVISAIYEKSGNYMAAWIMHGFIDRFHRLSSVCRKAEAEKISEMTDDAETARRFLWKC